MHARYLGTFNQKCRAASIAAIIGMALVASSNAGVLVLSSQSKTLRKKIQLLEAIKYGLALACFTHHDCEDYECPSYFGRFSGDTQYGSFWDTSSKEWNTCFRRIVGVRINTDYISVPRLVIRGLNEGYLCISAAGQILLTRTGERYYAVVLDSQSSHSFCSAKRDEDEQLEPQEKQRPASADRQLHVDAGAHHTQRYRTRELARPSLAAFEMSTIHADETTRQADMKSILGKYNEQVRSHFANHSGCQSAQFDGLVETAKELKVLVPGPGGSLQEEIRSLPATSDLSDETNDNTNDNVV